MKLFFDPTIFHHGACGHTRYLASLLLKLQCEEEISLIVPPFFCECPYLSVDDYISLGIEGRFKAKLRFLLRNLCSQNTPRNTWLFQNIAGKLSLLLNSSSHRAFRRGLQREDFDLLHIGHIYYSNRALRTIVDTPFVMTIHDLMSCRKMDDSFEDDARSHWEQQAYLARKASRIIAISEHTKREIVENYHIAKEKISVVYHGSSFEQLVPQAGKTTPIISGRYIFFPGSRIGRKNFTRFIRAAATVLSEDPSLRVVCTGNGFSLLESELLLQLGILDQLICLPANDLVLINLYQNALCTIYPSLYEGFGLPVLESFHCGSPLILSKESSLPEVGGEAALYIDPYNEASIQSAIASLLRSADLRDELRAKGYQQVKRFTVDRMIKETLRVYRNVLKV